MSFITDRMRIDAKSAITEGNKAVAISEDQADRLRIAATAYASLSQVEQNLSDYYGKHRFLGRIVKFFDTHSIFGHFNKYNKVKELLDKLKPIHDIAVRQGIIKPKEAAVQVGEVDLKALGAALQENDGVLPANHPLFAAWEADKIRWRDLPSVDNVDETQFMHEVHLYSAKLMPVDHPYYAKWQDRLLRTKEFAGRPNKAE